MATKTRSLDEDLQRALSVIFRTEVDKKEQKQIIEEVVHYWKESVNPGSKRVYPASYVVRLFGIPQECC